MSATHQLMANSMSNTAARLDSAQKQARQIQTMTVSSSNDANSGAHRDRMSNSSVASSSSISDQSVQEAARISVGQQPGDKSNKRRERSTDDERVFDRENQLDVSAIAASSSSSSGNYVAGPVNAQGGGGYNPQTTTRRSRTTTRPSRTTTRWSRTTTRKIVYPPPTTTRSRYTTTTTRPRTTTKRRH